MDIQKTGKRIEQELIARYSVKGKGKIITLDLVNLRDKEREDIHLLHRG